MFVPSTMKSRQPSDCSGGDGAVAPTRAGAARPVSTSVADEAAALHDLAAAVARPPDLLVESLTSSPALPPGGLYPATPRCWCGCRGLRFHALMTRWCMPASEPLSKTGDNFLREPRHQGRLLRIRVTEHLDRHVRWSTRSRADTPAHPLPGPQHGVERIAFTQRACLATTRALRRVVWTRWSRECALLVSRASRPDRARHQV